MNYRLGTLGLIAAMVLSLPSHAQDEGGSTEESSGPTRGAKAKLERKLYVSPMGNYLKAANARGTDDGFGGTIAVGKSVTNGLNLELIGQYLIADPKTGNGSKAELKGVGLGAMVFPSNYLPGLYVPISVMRGQVNKNPGPIPDYSTTFFDVGLGYLIGLGSVGDFLGGTSLRAQVSYRIDAHGRERAGIHTGERKAFYEGVAGLGVLIPLGATPVAAEPAPVEEAPAEVVPVAAGDADNDGVPDDKDQCPDTPAGATVDENGCPPPAAAPEPTPPPACTPPAAGEPIDLNGCKAGDAIVLRGVTFELDSARLTPNAKVILDGVADALLAQQGIKAELGGYTSSEGSEAHNQKLSEKRAESVMQYLVGRGITADRLTNKGYGESSPVADNNTEEGRELNRRVELKVTGNDAPPAAEPAPAAEAAPAEAAPAEAAPADAAAAPAEGEAAPADAAAAPAEGEAAPADATPAPAEGETPPAEAPPADAPPADAPPADTPPADAPAPEVENAAPAQ